MAEGKKTLPGHSKKFGNELGYKKKPFLFLINFRTYFALICVESFSWRGWGGGGGGGPARPQEQKTCANNSLAQSCQTRTGTRSNTFPTSTAPPAPLSTATGTPLGGGGNRQPLRGKKLAFCEDKSADNTRTCRTAFLRSGKTAAGASLSSPAADRAAEREHSHTD